MYSPNERFVKRIGCVPGTAHVLRVSLQFPIMEVKASPKPSQMEAKGVAVLQRGIGDGASEGSNSARILGIHVLKDM